jgi:hypothetical protein
MSQPMVYSHCSKCGGGRKHHHRSSKRKESGHIEPSYFELYFQDSKSVKSHKKHSKKQDDEAKFGGICRNCS